MEPGRELGLRTSDGSSTSFRCPVPGARSQFQNEYLPPERVGAVHFVYYVDARSLPTLEKKGETRIPWVEEVSL